MTVPSMLKRLKFTNAVFVFEQLDPIFLCVGWEQFAGEVITSFYCAACAFWFQTNHHPIDVVWSVFGTIKSDCDVSVHQQKHA